MTQKAFQSIGGFIREDKLFMRHFTRNATDQSIKLNAQTVHQSSLLHIESNPDRLELLSSTHGQRSQQQSGQITLQSVLINKPKFLKATSSRKKENNTACTYSVDVRISLKTLVIPRFGTTVQLSIRIFWFQNELQVLILVKVNTDSTPVVYKALPGT